MCLDPCLSCGKHSVTIIIIAVIIIIDSPPTPAPAPTPTPTPTLELYHRKFWKGPLENQVLVLPLTPKQAQRVIIPFTPSCPVK